MPTLADESLINRTALLDEISNEVVRATFSILLAEHVTISDEIDRLTARKAEIMTTIQPFAESLQLKSVKSDLWTLSRKKGNVGATTVYIYDLVVKGGIPAGAVIAAIPKIDLGDIDLPRIVQDFGVSVDKLNAALAASSTKKPDGKPSYTVRRNSTKDVNGGA